MVMTSTVSPTQPVLDAKLKLYYVATPRQVTFTDSVEDDDGIDNPFRPGGGLSREADIIVQMIKAGKPITPTSPTREDIQELEQELLKRQLREQQEHQFELERNVPYANDVSNRSHTNDSFTRVDSNGGPLVVASNGNNNIPSSKPSSPNGSAGKRGEKNFSPTENSTQQQEKEREAKNFPKKNSQRTCCVVQ